MSIFDTIVRSYDVRGIYPDDIDEDAVKRLGKAIAVWLNAKAIVVGRDCRESSPALAEALIEGLTSQGVHVYDIGLSTSPILYFASGEIKVDGGVMITASHNPPRYNGMKLVKKDAVPVGYETGLKEIKELAERDAFEDAAKPGAVETLSFEDTYRKQLIENTTLEGKDMTIVTDTANMMGALMLPVFRSFEPMITTHALYEDLDGSMPNHEANPIKPSTLEDLSSSVRSNKADLGIAYDGDADRVAFVDETGKAVAPHLITALLARKILQDNPGATIAYDIPSTRSVKEEIEKHGGKPLLSKVGMVNIKNAMREKKAVFGGEFSGHFYYQDHHYSEVPTKVALMVIEMMMTEKKPLSALIESVDHYHHSGEILFELTPKIDKDKLLEKIKQAYSDGDVTEIDGVRVDYENWWFLVRPSNTEPLMKLFVEATSKQQLTKKVNELSEHMK